MVAFDPGLNTRGIFIILHYGTLKSKSFIFWACKEKNQIEYLPTTKFPSFQSKTTKHSGISRHSEKSDYTLHHACNQATYAYMQPQVSSVSSIKQFSNVFAASLSW